MKWCCLAAKIWGISQSINMCQTESKAVKKRQHRQHSQTNSAMKARAVGCFDSVMGSSDKLP